MRKLALLLALSLGCSSSDPSPPLVEYPPLSDAGDPDTQTTADVGTDVAADHADVNVPLDGAPDTSIPPTVQQLLTGSTFIEGATSDRHLVFDLDGDLMVWPESASAPVLVVQDYQVGTDSLLVRGRFVGAWLGMDPTPPLTLWSAAGAVETIGPESRRSALYPRSAANDLAYLTPGLDALHVDVYATSSGQGAGFRIVDDVDTALLHTECQIQVGYTTDDLLVAGCPQGATVPRLAGYDLSGGGLTRTILANSAPGFWLNHARSQVLAQTSLQSTLYPLTTPGSTVPLDGPIKQARFSADDSVVVVLTTDGALKRAATQAPPNPVTLAQADVILGRSADVRYVAVATTGAPINNRSDLVLVDTTASPPASQVLADADAALVGFSKSGTELVYLAELDDLFFEGSLYVLSLPSGQPVRLSEQAKRVVFDATAVFWFEQQPGQFTAELKAVRVADPGTVHAMGADHDGLTVHARAVGEYLYVASKEGLWQHPALVP